MKNLKNFTDFVTEAKQGYNDREDESIAARTGAVDTKDFGSDDKAEALKADRDESYGKFGKREEEHPDQKIDKANEAAKTMAGNKEIAEMMEMVKEMYEMMEGMKETKEEYSCPMESYESLKEAHKGIKEMMN